ncbi:MAG: cell division protein FtsK [Bacteroidetes bacterium]|nr:MAG: cell division protein FtsK [Bacteroidota bacterium]
MAKKTKPAKAEKNKPVVDERLVLLAGLFTFIFALFLLVAFVSYLYTWEADQSLTWQSLLKPFSISAKNLMGPIGASLASIAISRGFGLGAFLLPFVFALWSLRILRVEVRRSVKKAAVLIIGMFLVSITFAFLGGDAKGYLGYGLGGRYGYYFVSLLTHYISMVGTGFLLLFLIVAYTVWINRAFAQRVFKSVETFVDRMRRGQSAIATAAQSIQREVIPSAGKTDVPPMEDSDGENLGDRGDVVSSGPVAPVEKDLQEAPPAPAHRKYYDEENTAPKAQGQPEPTELTPGHTESHGPAGVPPPEVEESLPVQGAPEEKGGETLGQSPFKIYRPGEADQQEQADEAPQGEPVPLASETKGEQKPLVEHVPASPVADTPTRPAEQPSSMVLEVEKRQDELTDASHISLDQPYDPTLDLRNYQMPPLELLEKHDEGQVEVPEEELVANKDKIIETLSNFGIGITKIRATVGPTVTLYEIVPAPGIKLNKIRSLEDDIALNLKAAGVRIIAPIPGKGTVGIEVPNANPAIVSMLGILRSKKFQETKFALPIALGKTISNEPFIVDLAKMPHLLVAGATGQGKSVGLNAIIASLLYSQHPSQLKFVMVDPKKVELTLYSKIEKHFLAKLPNEDDAIITDTDKVINTLNSLCIEMDERYALLKLAMVRNLKEYNERFISRRLSPEKGHRFLPYIVLIIDEYADLIMTAGREIEMPIARLAQLARAIGIHLVIATQRPTTNIITGLIKANFPARIAFRVTSGIDSKTILDGPGANQLIGRGDMLVYEGTGITRVQCAFLDTPEVERITDFIGNQNGYPSALELPEYNPEGEAGPDSTVLQDLDELFKEVATAVVENQRCSTSQIQRQYSIGFNRAGRIVDQLEAAGIVSAQSGSKPREVQIADLMTLKRIFETLE